MKQSWNGCVLWNSLTEFQHYLNGWNCKVFDIMTMIKIMAVMAPEKNVMHKFCILIHYEGELEVLTATKSKEKKIIHYCQTLLSGLS